MEKKTREMDWRLGFHTGSSGKTQQLANLPAPYLKNIINKYGEDHDVSPVQAELDSRPADQK